MPYKINPFFQKILRVTPGPDGLRPTVSSTDFLHKGTALEKITTAEKVEGNLCTAGMIYVYGTDLHRALWSVENSC